MRRYMLKSKIHRAVLTATELHYEGSIAIDQNLLELADILPGEQVHVLNINTGDRLITYAITAPAGSGTISLNGAAARMGAPGDPVIIIAYCDLEDGEARRYHPKVIHVDEKNRPREHA
ncbi:MAG TPA: aspartate 1-decarboxylase [Phycisphaerae bacterium]|nr:aspartate 1-decarboxylase [Phycisphaerae bacterium]HOB76458.1 aspartate 1-decarboxylase [Phycisphaerae bacterium]HOJ55369.1 aspartate 1-decarboxylase [Phycisphaerae bacterium]HOL25122.1 aspartate 1-decarboxylase [Phycisphaerae bacterium]HPP19702.1 aspartate 1-decarboxylase [Phycisphaerae bacterium]